MTALPIFNVRVERADGGLDLSLSVQAEDADRAKRWVIDQYGLTEDFRLTATRAHRNPRWR